MATAGLDHRCIKAANEALAKAGKNTRLTQALDLASGTWRIVIATQKVNCKTRGKPVLICATYCPFCGEKLHVEQTDSKRATSQAS
jgi:hypothetical protein